MRQLPRVLRALVHILFLVMLAGSARAESFPELPAVAEFVDEMVERHGFARAELLDLFAEAQVLNSVLEAIARPAEAKPWHEYRRIFLTRDRIDAGVVFWRSQAAALERAAKTYGVEPAIVVAIIGVETRYGRRTGTHRVFDSLATLAFHYPRRGAFFRSELEHYLLLTRELGLAPRLPTGSYAGAMGYSQFISSSYRHYAVDFDGDGRVDLFDSPVDAIGSVANYLAEHRWTPGQPIVFPAKVAGDGAADLLRASPELDTPLATFRQLGIISDETMPEQSKGFLFRLDGDGGPEYWVGLQNFYSITRYNRSVLYAMAVYQLAEEIRRAKALSS